MHRLKVIFFMLQRPVSMAWVSHFLLLSPTNIHLAEVIKWLFFVRKCRSQDAPSQVKCPRGEQRSAEFLKSFTLGIKEGTPEFVTWHSPVDNGTITIYFAKKVVNMGVRMKVTWGFINVCTILESNLDLNGSINCVSISSNIICEYLTTLCAALLSL